MGMTLVSVVTLLCMNAVTQADMEQSVKNIKVVDAALEVNDFAKAKQWLDWVYGYLADARTKPGAVQPPAGHVRRAARAKALLLSRDPKSTAAQRETAKTIYEKQVLGTSPDPVTQASYGEILARIPAETAKATTILRALRDKDLIGSPHAYAALADLEKAAGDTAAETAARDKCKTQTKVPAICAAAPPPVTASASDPRT